MEMDSLAYLKYQIQHYKKLIWNETLPSMQKKFVLEYLGKEAAGQHYAAILPNKKNEHFFTLTANSVLCEKMFIFKN